MKHVKVILQQLVNRPANAIFLSSCILFTNSLGQSGGSFTIEKSVIAPGGTKSGGAFNVESVIAQPAAGNASGGAYLLFGGFIQPPLAPTSASVSVSGRIVTVDGSGIRNAIVEIADATGNIRTARTGSMGYFRFEDVESGRSYILRVRSKRFQFASQVIMVNEEISELMIVAL